MTKPTPEQIYEALTVLVAHKISEGISDTMAHLALTQFGVMSSGTRQKIIYAAHNFLGT